MSLRCQIVDELQWPWRNNCGLQVGFDIAGRPQSGNLEYSLRRLKQEVISDTGKFFGTKKLTVHTAEVVRILFGLWNIRVLLVAAYGPGGDLCDPLP